mgnify:FL=1
MTDTETIPEETLDPNSPLGALLMAAGEDPEALWHRISGGLEFLTLRALNNGPFYIEDENQTAVIVFAVHEDAKAVKDTLPENVRSFADDVEPFTTNSDPGDEQPDDEPAA